jgi:hypothetical protein
MTTAPCVPADALAPEISGRMSRSEVSQSEFLCQEVSKMNMICRWVHADDGALVMQWTAAEGTADHQGTGSNEAAYAFEVFDHNADALTPVGV